MTMLATELDFDAVYGSAEGEDEQDSYDAYYNDMDLVSFEDAFGQWIYNHLDSTDSYDAIMDEFIEDCDQQPYSDPDEVTATKDFLNEHYYHFRPIFEAEQNRSLFIND